MKFHNAPAIIIASELAIATIAEARTTRERCEVATIAQVDS